MIFIRYLFVFLGALGLCIFSFFCANVGRRIFFFSLDYDDQRENAKTKSKSDYVNGKEKRRQLALTIKDGQLRK